AGVEVNGHAPGVSFFFIGIGVVEREPRRWLCFFFMREVGRFAIFLQRGLATQRTMAAIRRVHCLVALRGCQLVSFSGLADFEAGRDPWRSSRAQPVGIEPLCSTDAAGSLAAVAQ